MIHDDIDNIIEEVNYIFTDDDLPKYRDVLCGLADSLEQYNYPWAHAMLLRVDNAIERVDDQITLRETIRRQAEIRPVEDFLKLLTGFVGLLVICSFLNSVNNNNNS